MVKHRKQMFGIVVATATELLSIVHQTKKHPMRVVNRISCKKASTR